MTKHVLFDAIRAGDVERCRRALDSGGDPNGIDGSWSALETAVELKRFEIASLLIDRGADVKQLSGGGGGTVLGRLQRLMEDELFAAIRSGNIETCRVLLDQGVDPNAFDGKWTALRMAVLLHHPDIASLLLERAADVRQCNDQGRTLLHEIARRGDVEACRFLIDAGVPLDGTDNEQWTALRTASAYGNVEVLKCLLEARARLDVVDKNGHGALHSAISRLRRPVDAPKAIEICRLLVASGMHPSHMPSGVEQDYLTPIQFAMSQDNEAALKFFVEGCAEALGQTTLDGRITQDLVASSPSAAAYVYAEKTRLAVSELLTLDAPIGDAEKRRSTFSPM